MWQTEWCIGRSSWVIILCRSKVFFVHWNLINLKNILKTLTHSKWLIAVSVTKGLTDVLCAVQPRPAREWSFLCDHSRRHCRRQGIMDRHTYMGQTGRQTDRWTDIGQTRGLDSMLAELTYNLFVSVTLQTTVLRLLWQCVDLCFHVLVSVMLRAFFRVRVSTNLIKQISRRFQEGFLEKSRTCLPCFGLLCNLLM